MAYTPVAQRKDRKQRQGYTPVAARFSYDPSEDSPLRRSFLEDLGSPNFRTSQSTSPVPVGPDTKDFAQSFAQGTGRSYLAAGQAIQAPFTQGAGLKEMFSTPLVQQNDDTFLGQLTRRLSGTDQPISASQEDIDFLGEDLGSKTGGGLSVALTALDLVGGGGVKGLKGLSSAVKAAKTVEETAEAMRLAGFADDIIESYAPKLVKLTDTKQIDKGLIAAETLQNSTRGGSYTPVAMRKTLPFEGFPDLSTKLLEKLKGRSTVSRQFIEDMTNSPDLKQAEKDLIRKTLADEGDTISVPDFANRVKSELLTLERGLPNDSFGRPAGSTGRNANGTAGVGFKYESINLPDELRGPVANYEERVYQSPIKTGAGNVHGFNVDNYFAHSRIEDLPDDGTRRVIEIQSDLFQKGRLEREGVGLGENKLGLGELSEAGKAKVAARQAEIAKLEPYRNTWHERVIREEVKQAALDGKTKLQFPTGETAMKIEGLGQSDSWGHIIENGRGGFTWEKISPEQLKPGKEVSFQDQDEWVITDVLGDGKFKAVPSDIVNYGTLERGTPADRKAMLEILNNSGNAETFDISGKVDTENPIYKFYDKTVRKYLANKYGAKEITDPQGVKWMEVDVKPLMADKPIEAFGFMGGLEVNEDGSIGFDPTKAAIGIAGLSLARRGGKAAGKLRLEKLPDELTNMREYINILEDVLSNHPGAELKRFVKRSKDAEFAGKLPELKGKNNKGAVNRKGQQYKDTRTKWEREGDSVFQELMNNHEGGFGTRLDSAEDAQRHLDDYLKQREELGELRQAYKEAVQEFRTNKRLDRLGAKSERLRRKQIEFSNKYPELHKATLSMSEEATRGAKKGYETGVKVTKKTARAATLEKVRLERQKANVKLAETRNALVDKLRTSGQVTNEVKTQLVDFAKQNLTKEDRGKALTLIKDAKTQRDLTKAFARMNRWSEVTEKKTIRNEILETQRDILNSPSIAVEYKNKVNALLNDYQLKGKSEKTIQNLAETQKYIDEELAKGNDVEMPRRVLHALETLNRKPIEITTINELRGVQAELELLETIGRTKQSTRERLWELEKEKILTEVAAQKAKPLTEIEAIKPEIGERLTATQKARNFINETINRAARIDKAITPMDAVFDLLDGGRATYDGANFRFFKGRVDAGYGRYIHRRAALQEPVIALVKKHKLNDKNFRRIGVVAAREQDGGMTKLVNSGFTKEQVEKVNLTPAEREVLDLMRSTFDSQFPEIQDVMRRVYNKPVEKVKNYFSFMTDWDAASELEVFERFGSIGPDQFGAPTKNVKKGFTESRTGGKQKIKTDALDIFLQHTDNTSYLLELGETTKMLGEVAASPKYGQAVGEAGQLLVREWIDVVARKGGAAGAKEIPLLDTLRKNVGAGILGLKLSTVAIQPTALIDGMGFIGTGYGMKGTANFLGNAEWRKFVSNMPEITDRLGGEFALRELTGDGWFESFQRKGFIPLQKLDQMTAGSIAAGAYERKMKELGRPIDLSGPYDKEALAYAQLAVRRTQSSGSFKDVPLAISRGALTGNRSLDRAMLQFQNFLLTRWSRIRHDAIRAGITEKDPKKAVPILATLIASSIAASGIRLGVDRVTDFITGDEDEDTASEDMTRMFWAEVAGSVPFLGTAISMAMYDGEMFPILDAPKGVISGANRSLSAKTESARLKGLTELTTSIGSLGGVPGMAQTEQLVNARINASENNSSEFGDFPELPDLPEFPELPDLPEMPEL